MIGKDEVLAEVIVHPSSNINHALGVIRNGLVTLSKPEAAPADEGATETPAPEAPKA